MVNLRFNCLMIRRQDRLYGFLHVSMLLKALLQFVHPAFHRIPVHRFLVCDIDALPLPNQFLGPGGITL